MEMNGIHQPSRDEGSEGLDLFMPSLVKLLMAQQAEEPESKQSHHTNERSGS